MDNLKQLEQLQEFLNKCIEQGRKPREVHYEGIVDITPQSISVDRLGVTFWFLRYGEDKQRKYSIHDLFAKESGIMEYVKRKEQGEYIGWCDKIAVHDSCEDFHYMQMSMMTAEEKIQYFLENALLPM